MQRIKFATKKTSVGVLDHSKHHNHDVAEVV